MKFNGVFICKEIGRKEINKKEFGQKKNKVCVQMSRKKEKKRKEKK